MTKTECVTDEFGFKRVRMNDFQEEKHDGSFYTVRVLEAVIEGVKFTLHCDNYYGRAILFYNGQKYGDIEQNYDRLKDILHKCLALENLGRSR